MIPLIKSTFYKEKQMKKMLVDFIRTAKQLSFGDKCQEFEKKFAEWQGRKQSILLNSGSSANLAIIQALLNLQRIKKGDLVGFSAVTWSTNVMPIIELGLHPVPIDISLETLNVSPVFLEETLKKYKIKMLFLTNLLGFCDKIDEIQKICKKEHIILVEDNCESLGSIYKRKKLGNFSIAATFSFYVGHHMSTIEGGSVVTDDEELATMVRIVRAHGWDRNLDFAKQEEIRKKFNVNSTFYSRYTFYDLGYNLRPTEITGFLGLSQMRYIQEIITKRQRNFLYFSKFLYKIPHYFPIVYDHMDVISNFAVPVICKTPEIRERLVRACSEKLEIRPIVGGDMTVQPFFKKYIFDNFKHCVNARIVHEQGLYFGNNPELTNKDLLAIKRICSL
ncbi:MAG: aminotransferase class V-fold PLP-dependent enzyme [Patescibacteria group bacterium]|nr:aminotransferase class V-fold PLP-dependent enzyme [Patescibacteria group bacterium]